MSMRLPEISRIVYMMKIKQLINNNVTLQFAILAFCGVIFVAGCTREDLTGSMLSGDNSLVFSVSEQKEWASVPETRSSGGEMTEAPLQVYGAEVPLYLHTSVEKGMPSGNSIDEGPQTKGSMREQSNFWERFSLFGYSYASGNGFNTSASLPGFLYNLQVNRQGDGTYRPDGTYLLPSAGTDVTFFAMAPYSADLLGGNNSTDVIPAATDAGTPRFDYLVPWYSTNQQDLCFIKGTEVTGGSTGEINLTFHHSLTAIRIVAAPDAPSGEVLGVRILRAPSRATYTPYVGNDANAVPGSWSNITPAGNDDIHHGLADYILEPGNGIRIGTGQEVVICGDESTYKGDEGRSNTFFMLPQTLDGNTVLEITYRPDGASANEVLSVSLTGQEWPMGSTVTYRLSSKEDLLEFEVEPNDPANLSNIPYGGKKNIAFNVLARRGSEDVPYKVEYSDDGQVWTPIWTSAGGAMHNLPAMIEAVSGNAVSGNPDFNFSQSLDVTETDVKYDNATQARLAGRAPSGTENNPTNLANGTSANCYIVDRPGYYEIPAVCGNAWLNNSFNSAVVNKGFPNYQGQPITSSNAWLTGVASAELLWQDVSGLISDLHYVTRDGRYYLRFAISSNRIAEGNAVIAALNQSGQVMWSWHIWVADGIGTVSIAGTDNVSRKILDRPIGFVEGGSKSWISRAGNIRFRLADVADADLVEGTSVHTFQINQSAGPTVNTAGRYTLYQWGRKDPLRPIERNDGNKIAPAALFTNGYNAHRDAMGQSLSSGEGVQYWILNPTKLSTNNNIANVLRSDLWNAAEGGQGDNVSQATSVTKSIYDPSPKGYKVPPYTVFGGLLRNGMTSALQMGDTRMTWYSAANAQYFLYTNGGTLTIPMAGLLRYVDGFAVTQDYYGISGYVWTAGKTAATLANQLYLVAPRGMIGVFDVFGTSERAPNQSQNRDFRNACPVIPVVD